MKLKRGIDEELEDQATELLRADRRAYMDENEAYKFDEMNFYFSESQMKMRLNREVYTGAGVPEKYVFQGCYHRAYNPNLKTDIKIRKIARNALCEPPYAGTWV